MDINTSININNKIEKIQQTEKINNKQRKCPLCGYPIEEHQILCEYCEFDPKN